MRVRVRVRESRARQVEGDAGARGAAAAVPPVAAALRVEVREGRRAQALHVAPGALLAEPGPLLAELLAPAQPLEGVPHPLHAAHLRAE